MGNLAFPLSSLTLHSVCPCCDCSIRRVLVQRWLMDAVARYLCKRPGQLVEGKWLCSPPASKFTLGSSFSLAFSCSCNDQITLLIKLRDATRSKTMALAVMSIVNETFKQTAGREGQREKGPFYWSDSLTQSVSPFAHGQECKFQFGTLARVNLFAACQSALSIHPNDQSLCVLCVSFHSLSHTHTQTDKDTH